MKSWRFIHDLYLFCFLLFGTIKKERESVLSCSSFLKETIICEVVIRSLKLRLMPVHCWLFVFHIEWTNLKSQVSWFYTFIPRLISIFPFFNNKKNPSFSDLQLEKISPPSFLSLYCKFEIFLQVVVNECANAVLHPSFQFFSEDKQTTLYTIVGFIFTHCLWHHHVLVSKQSFNSESIRTNINKWDFKQTRKKLISQMCGSRCV